MRGASRRSIQALGLLAALVAAPPASPASTSESIPLVALTADDRLLRFSSTEPGAATNVPLELPDPLCGIDLRPADGRLYGVTFASEVYTIDPSSGRATLESTLIHPFDGQKRSAVDFTPLADRLRLMTHDGQNLRVHVNLGATAIDGPLRYATDDPAFGSPPEIAGTAYTHNVPEPNETIMYDIDSARDTLILQDPPNEGTLRTVGPLGVDVPTEVGFEIITDASGVHRAFLAFGSSLFEVNLQTGEASRLGEIGGNAKAIVGLSAASPTWESP